MPTPIEQQAVVRFVAAVQTAAEQHFGPTAKVLGVWNDAERISGMMILSVRIVPDMAAVASAAAGSEETPP